MASDQLIRIRLVPGELEALYRRLFNNADGQLIMQDLEDRFFYNTPVESATDEGMRRALLHIKTMCKPETPAKDTEAQE
jgi:hypothetical protein